MSPRASLRLRRSIAPSETLGLALDGGLLAAADLDPARLRDLRLLHVDLEHAVLVFGVDLLLGHALRQADRARERAEPALVAVEALVRDFVGALALGAYGQGPVL